MSELEPGTPGRTTRGDAVDHARIDELLAGHALHSLEGGDLREAEGILAEHVPTCERCRATVEGFRAITADLALGSRPAAPPEVLLPRLRRETMAIPLDQQPAPSGPRRAFGSWLSAAAALMLVGLVLSNAFLHVRLHDVRSTQRQITRVTHFMAQPDAQTVALESASPASRVLLGFREAQVALFGSDVPEPGDGHVYRLWVGTDANEFTHVIDFVPENGVVALVLEFDARKFDQIFVTEEPGGEPAANPAGKPIWSAHLRPAPPASSEADEQA